VDLQEHDATKRSRNTSNMMEFVHNTQALWLSQKIKLKRGNCCGGHGEEEDVDISVKKTVNHCPKDHVHNWTVLSLAKIHAIWS